MKDKLLKTLMLMATLTQSLSCISVSAQENSNYLPTDWGGVNSSMTDLLNSGWQIITQSSYRSILINPNSSIRMDEAKYVYTLHKNGKYITCIIQNPKINNSLSGCRSLN
jgi:hypothetical protein